MADSDLTVTILRRAQKELSNLPQDYYTRVRDEIRKLAEESRVRTDQKNWLLDPGGESEWAPTEWFMKSMTRVV